MHLQDRTIIMYAMAILTAMPCALWYFASSNFCVLMTCSIDAKVSCNVKPIHMATAVAKPAGSWKMVAERSTQTYIVKWKFEYLPQLQLASSS